MVRDCAPNGTLCASCKPLALQGGKRDLCPSRGPVKGFLRCSDGFPRVVPSPLGRVLNGRSPCSCEYVLTVPCDVTLLDRPHVQLLMVFVELKCLKCCMKYVTKIDFFSIFNTSELRVHGPISAIFNDLFSVYNE